MKKYILTGIVLLVVSATASENPFDLKENFGLLDQDQEVLLSELKKIAETKELAEEKAMDNEEEKELETKVSVEEPIEELPLIEIDNIVSSSDERIDDMRQKVLEKTRQESLQKAIASKKIELEKAKEEERIAAVKKEEEKREVEAYEKKRLERLARKAAALEKEALVQNEANEKKKSEKVAVKTVEKIQATKEVISEKKVEVEVKEEEKSIDIEREKEEAKIAADKAYEESIKEMSQEESIAEIISKQELVSKNSASEKKKSENVAVKTVEKVQVAGKEEAKGIDIEREKKEAKIDADKAYEEAVKEMSQEDTLSS